MEISLKMVRAKLLAVDRLKGDISSESGGMISEDGTLRWAKNYAFSCLSFIRWSLRAVLLSVLHDLNHSGQLKVAQQRLTISSKKGSTLWLFVVVTVPLQELIFSDRNGQPS